MKNQQIKNLKRCAIVVCLSLMINSCENPLEKVNENDLYGKITLDISVELTVNEFRGRKSEVLIDDFQIDVWTVGGELYQSFARFADMPSEIPLESGNYYVSAHSPNDMSVAFDNPFYYGESDIFSINYEEQKVISITPFLSNCMVTVVYQQSILDNFIDYTTMVTSTEGALIFGKEETRSGYFPPIPLDIEATLSFENPDGTPATKTLSGSIPDPKPQTLYQVTIDASLATGSGTLSIQVDETLFSELVSISEGSTSTVEGPIGYGDLIITEIMYNPAAVSDTEGEWFEVFNTSSEQIDLFQLVIKKGMDVQHTVNEHILINPQEFFVLARHVNATIVSGYIYGTGLTLTNSGDDLILANYGDDGTNGSTICSVDYGLTGFPDGNGASINLNPDSFDVNLAKAGVSWCLPTSSFDTGDLGTPGTMNDICN